MKMLSGMAVLFLAATTTAQAEDAEERSVELHGSCRYGAEVQRRAGQPNVLMFCDEATIEPGAAVTFFDDGYRRARYAGDFDGSEMEIRELQLRNQPAKPARGTCTIYRRGAKILTITCIGVVRNVTYAANFIPE